MQCSLFKAFKLESCIENFDDYRKLDAKASGNSLNAFATLFGPSPRAKFSCIIGLEYWIHHSYQSFLFHIASKPGRSGKASRSFAAPFYERLQFESPLRFLR